MKTETRKPKCKLSGTDGNVFALMGLVARTLKKAGLAEQVPEMRKKVAASGSYTEALGVLASYVEVY